MELNDEDAMALVAILKDHRECIENPDECFNDRFTSGKEVIEKLGEFGHLFNEEELDSKANLIWQVDELIEKLGG
jgi:hypothetical protein